MNKLFLLYKYRTGLWIWKEVVLVWFKLICWHLPERIKAKPWETLVKAAVFELMPCRPLTTSHYVSSQKTAVLFSTYHHKRSQNLCQDSRLKSHIGNFQIQNRVCSTVTELFTLILDAPCLASIVMVPLPDRPSYMPHVVLQIVNVLLLVDVTRLTLGINCNCYLLLRALCPALGTSRVEIFLKVV
jgi:hypothetical protein